MAEILAVDASSFFQDRAEDTNRIVFPEEEAVEIKLSDLPEGSVYAKLFTPVDVDLKAEPYLIEIPPNKTIPSHFFIHKGEEIGYLLSGKLQLKMEKAVYNVKAGDVVCLTSEMPSQWKNLGSGVARLLWMKIK
jgi:quercetin dioxygenase-like cupin family protein